MTYAACSNGTFDMNLSFLHPVSTLIVCIRRTADMNSSHGGPYSATSTTVKTCAQKGYFFYHGDGNPPNYDVWCTNAGKPDTVLNSTCKTSAFTYCRNTTPFVSGPRKARRVS